MRRLLLTAWSVLALSVGAASAQGAPDNTASRVELIAKVPMLALLQKYDSATFEVIATAFEAGQRQGRPIDALVEQAREAANVTYNEKLVASPDDLVLAAVESMLYVAADLQSKAPDRCAALLLGRPAGDIRLLLRPTTIAREDQVHEAVFQSPSVPGRIASAELEKSLTEASLPSAALILEISAQSLVQNAAGLGPPGAACLAHAEILRAMAAEQPAGAAAVVRRRFSVEKP